MATRWFAVFIRGLLPAVVLLAYAGCDRPRPGTRFDSTKASATSKTTGDQPPGDDPG